LYALLEDKFFSGHISSQASNRRKIMSIGGPDLIALWERGMGVCREWVNWNR
jgi:hypothetical protein